MRGIKRHWDMFSFTVLNKWPVSIAPSGYWYVLEMAIILLLQSYSFSKAVDEDSLYQHVKNKGVLPYSEGHSWYVQIVAIKRDMIVGC